MSFSRVTPSIPHTYRTPSPPSNAEPGSASSPSVFPHLSRTRLGISYTGFFMGQMPFLSPNKQTASKHWPSARPLASSFVHPTTDNGRRGHCSLLCRLYDASMPSSEKKTIQWLNTFNLPSCKPGISGFG